MLRTPEPKERAKLLVKLLKDAGLELGHQKSLAIVAQLEGYRNWNAMEAAQSKASQATVASKVEPAMPEGIEHLMAAAEKVVSWADNEGCGDDLTVTCASGVAELDKLLGSFKLSGKFVAATRTTQHGFSAEDVQSVRPDLTLEEADEVVDIADRDFDASVGVNWDILETHANMRFPKRLVEAQLVEQQSGTLLTPVVIDYSRGLIYCATLAELKASTQRHKLELSAKVHSRELSLKGTPVVTLPDGVFIDIEPETSFELFDGDTEALRNSIDELRESEKARGAKFIQDIRD